MGAIFETGNSKLGKEMTIQFVIKFMVNAVNLSPNEFFATKGRHSGGSRNPVFSDTSGPRLSPG